MQLSPSLSPEKFQKLNSSNLKSMNNQTKTGRWSTNKLKRQDKKPKKNSIKLYGMPYVVSILANENLCVASNF